MNPKTSPSSPVAFPQLWNSQKTSVAQPVVFPLAESGSPKPTCNKLSDVLRHPIVGGKIISSKVFVFGKVGFFDLVFSQVSDIFPNIFSIDPTIIRSTTDLRGFKPNSRNTANQSQPPKPLIVIPAVENSESTNKLIANVLKLRRPIWLVALPSQIQRQLLLSFNCFFVPSGPEDEMKILANITPIMDDDIEKLEKNSDVLALFAIDKKIQDLGEPKRLGTVVYINQLD